MAEERDETEMFWVAGIVKAVVKRFTVNSETGDKNPERGDERRERKKSRNLPPPRNSKRRKFGLSKLRNQFVHDVSSRKKHLFRTSRERCAQSTGTFKIFLQNKNSSIPGFGGINNQSTPILKSLIATIRINSRMR